MSTTARKARKREGVKFERTPKVGTPLADRALSRPIRVIKGVPTDEPSRREKRAAKARAAVTGESL